MEELIKKYLELKEQIAALEEQKKSISARFKAGLAALEVGSMKVPVDDKVYQVKFVSRASHSVQYEAFKNLHPEIYAQFVSDSNVEYVDVRKVNGE